MIEIKIFMRNILPENGLCAADLSNKLQNLHLKAPRSQKNRSQS